MMRRMLLGGWWRWRCVVWRRRSRRRGPLSEGRELDPVMRDSSFPPAKRRAPPAESGGAVSAHDAAAVRRRSMSRCFTIFTVPIQL